MFYTAISRFVHLLRVQRIPIWTSPPLPRRHIPALEHNTLYLFCICFQRVNFQGPIMHCSDCSFPSETSWQHDTHRPDTQPRHHKAIGSRQPMYVFTRRDSCCSRNSDVALAASSESHGLINHRMRSAHLAGTFSGMSPTTATPTIPFPHPPPFGPSHRRGVNVNHIKCVQPSYATP